jgi:hypothetical protein
MQKLASEIQIGEVIKMNSISGLLFDDFRVESIQNEGDFVIFRGDTICCKNQPYKRYANKMIEVLDRPSTMDRIKAFKSK